MNLADELEPVCRHPWYYPTLIYVVGLLGLALFGVSCSAFSGFMCGVATRAYQAGAGE